MESVKVLEKRKILTARLIFKIDAIFKMIDSPVPDRYVIKGYPKRTSMHRICKIKHSIRHAGRRDRAYLQLNTSSFYSQLQLEKS